MLSSAQCGFQCGLSTSMALLDLQTSFTYRFFLNIYFLISIVFDAVNHNIINMQTVH